MRMNASGWTATSASTNTSTFPVASSAPALRACAAPSPGAVSTTSTSLGASSAAAIALRQRSIVPGSSVAGTITDSRTAARSPADGTAWTPSSVAASLPTSGQSYPIGRPATTLPFDAEYRGTGGGRAAPPDLRDEHLLYVHGHHRIALPVRNPARARGRDHAAGARAWAHADARDRHGVRSLDAGHRLRPPGPRRGHSHSDRPGPGHAFQGHRQAERGARGARAARADARQTRGCRAPDAARGGRPARLRPDRRAAPVRLRPARLLLHRPDAGR